MKMEETASRITAFDERASIPPSNQNQGPADGAHDPRVIPSLLRCSDEAPIERKIGARLQHRGRTSRGRLTSTRATPASHTVMEEAAKGHADTKSTGKDPRFDRHSEGSTQRRDA